MGISPGQVAPTDHLKGDGRFPDEGHSSGALAASPYAHKRQGRRKHSRITGSAAPALMATTAELPM